MTIKDQFDIARKAWPGIRASLDVEWDNLRKVCKVHKLNGSKVVPLLIPSIERYVAYCNQRKVRGDFVESPCSFTVYINQRRWTREYPVFQQFKFKEETQHSDNTGWIMEQTSDDLKIFIQRWPNYVDRIKELRPEIFDD